MYGYIYETTNLINGKKYIGKHKSKVFDSNYYGSGKSFTRALNKYGKENFSVRVLEEVETEEDLHKRETYFIEMFDAVRSSKYYNNSYGGESEGWQGVNKAMKDNPAINGMYGKHHSEETKDKIREKARLRVRKIS